MAWGRAFFILSLFSTLPAFASASSPKTVYLVQGLDVAPRIRQRINELLKSVSGIRVVETSPTALPAAETLSTDSLIISLGQTPTTRSLISEKDLQSEGPEGFIVRSKVANGVTTIAADGNSAKGERTMATTNRGVSFAAYEVLQQIGFHFNHPFAPTSPKTLSLPLKPLDVSEKPRWSARGVHLHTMHPIELSHVLNGWGPNGPQDASGFASELSEWELFAEWMIAHRQNQVEWVLLADKTHATFNDSDERVQRLRTLVEIAHSWGLLAGVDVGIVFEQQNMWRLLRNESTDAGDSIEIRARTTWLMKAGWDFITAEMGSSEFTSPSDQKMLAWLNVLTDQMERVFNRAAAVKIHVTGGQGTDHFKDPDTREPLNFNFLPVFADSRLVVLPHTVELYSLDDPAPTYGNTNLNEMHRFLSMTAGARPVLFYPEAAYWVSYDIDTPLFLPSYAERRLHDLRLLAREEEVGALGRGVHKGAHIQGQMLFTSGFEWGYWFNQLVAMHAAWNPRLGENDRDAFTSIVREILRPNAASAATTDALTNLLVETIHAQNELLIQGRINGKAPRQIERLTGIAYLSGQETWDEINTSLSDVLGIKKATTQPSRLGLRSLRVSANAQGVDFTDEVHPLLDAMEVSFSSLSNRMLELFSKTSITDNNKDVLSEFADGMMMNALRATQIHALYDADAAGVLFQSSDFYDGKIERARQMVDLASDVVSRRERAYRSKFDRISEWQTNPSVYNYGYLWTVHSLQWWYRDEGSVTQAPTSVCYMNIIDPASTIFADGHDNTIYQIVEMLTNLTDLGAMKECLSPSFTEPRPRNRARSPVSDHQ